jgi:hypothetical protein
MNTMGWAPVTRYPLASNAREAIGWGPRVSRVTVDRTGLTGKMTVGLGSPVGVPPDQLPLFTHELLTAPLQM